MLQLGTVAKQLVYAFITQYESIEQTCNPTEVNGFWYCIFQGLNTLLIAGHSPAVIEDYKVCDNVRGLDVQH